ncbi:MAG: stage II sporulation protein R [Clostridia bacterium]|nr:stage II sporulation protein R [Clostridia bacterium]
MKKLCITFLIIGIIVLSGIGLLSFGEQPHKEYLRIHIRANSNISSDQQIKYIVKDKIVAYLTPFIAECDTKEKAENMLQNNLFGIEQVAKTTLRQNGFDYSVKASVKREEFPTRVYDGVCLESGFYDALIIELGSGKGDNWWCVVYPPLCFTGGGQGYVYRSKILDIINDFFNKEK